MYKKNKQINDDDDSINSNNGANSNIDQRPTVMAQASFPQSII